jgi:hypothetical protein
LPRVPTIDGGSVAVPAPDPAGKVGFWIMQGRAGR